MIISEIFRPKETSPGIDNVAVAVVPENGSMQELQGKGTVPGKDSVKNCSLSSAVSRLLARMRLNPHGPPFSLSTSAQ